MASTPVPAPTEAELEVLRVLWDRGACTVREVFTVIATSKTVGYTTVLTQMQVMHRKGLLSRSERFRSHVYEPSVDRGATRQQLASTMLQKVFDGSARDLLQSALAGRRVSAQELEEIRTLIEEHTTRTRRT